MEQRLSLITLGVTDLKRSKNFYQQLGWQLSPKSNDDVAFFQLPGMVVSLFPREELAKDAGVSASGEGFRCFALAYNVREKILVGETLREAEKAGAHIVKPAEDVFWGGHRGYFTDLDGFLWEVAWNPGGNLDTKGGFNI